MTRNRDYRKIGLVSSSELEDRLKSLLRPEDNNLFRMISVGFFAGYSSREDGVGVIEGLKHLISQIANQPLDELRESFLQCSDVISAGMRETGNLVMKDEVN